MEEEVKLKPTLRIPPGTQVTVQFSRAKAFQALFAKTDAREERKDLARQSSDALESRNEKQESAVPVARPVSPAQVNASSAQGASEQVPAVRMRSCNRHSDCNEFESGWLARHPLPAPPSPAREKEKAE